MRPSGASRLVVVSHRVGDPRKALQRALSTPLVERRERHAAPMESIRRDDVHAWWRSFLEALARTRRIEAQKAPAA